MDAQDKQLFMLEATRAFRLQRVTADKCYAHTQSCLICRGIANKWLRRVVEFLFECHDVKHLAVDARLAKDAADEYRLGLEERARNLYQEIYHVVANEETPSLQWLDDLFRLRDDREE